MGHVKTAKNSTPVRYFGTDGIRGSWGDGVINEAFAEKLGAALARFVKTRQRKGLPVTAYIGRDTRESGEKLARALINGLKAEGVMVCDLGVISTPAVALTVQQQQADLGVVITASHNPAKDNGYKVFGPGGFKLTRAEEAAIEAEIGQEMTVENQVKGCTSHCFDGLAHYINYLRSLLDEGCLRDWVIVMDLANGATTATAPTVFERWGAQVHLIGNEPDGRNINKGVGSEYTEQLGKAVLKHKARVGLAFDGDGDRLVVVDEKGKSVPGEALLALLAVAAQRKQQLKKSTLVTTIQSNGALDDAIAAAGGATERTDVGDRNVLHRMQEIGATLGGESSGHIIFSDLAPSGDGLLTAVKFLEVLLAEKENVSTLAARYPLYPQAEATLPVSAKPPIEELPKLSAAIIVADKALQRSGGRLLVRYSGTEPKLRFLVEAEQLEVAQAHLESLLTAASVDFGVTASS